MDADHLGNLAPPILTRRRPAATAPLAQQRNQLLLELSAGIGIDGVVDRLVRHTGWDLRGACPAVCGQFAGATNATAKDHRPRATGRHAGAAWARRAAMRRASQAAWASLKA